MKDILLLIFILSTICSKFLKKSKNLQEIHEAGIKFSFYIILSVGGGFCLLALIVIIKCVIYLKKKKRERNEEKSHFEENTDEDDPNNSNDLPGLKKKQNLKTPEEESSNNENEDIDNDSNPHKPSYKLSEEISDNSNRNLKENPNEESEDKDSSSVFPKILKKHTIINQIEDDFNQSVNKADNIKDKLKDLIKEAPKIKDSEDDQNYILEETNEDYIYNSSKESQAEDEDQNEYAFSRYKTTQFPNNIKLSDESKSGYNFHQNISKRIENTEPMPQLQDTKSKELISKRVTSNYTKFQDSDLYKNKTTNTLPSIYLKQITENNYKGSQTAHVYESDK